VEGSFAAQAHGSKGRPIILEIVLLAIGLQVLALIRLERLLATFCGRFELTSTDFTAATVTLQTFWSSFVEFGDEFLGRHVAIGFLDDGGYLVPINSVLT